MPPPTRRKAAAAPSTHTAVARDRQGRRLRTLTAASQILSSRHVDRTPPPRLAQGARTWHGEAWDLYDETTEFHSAATIMANSVSRVGLVAARFSPDGEPETVTTGRAADLVASLAGGTGGQEQLIQRLALQLFTLGDSYIVGRDEGGDEGDLRAYSTEEVTPSGTGRAAKWKLDDGSGAPVVLADEDLLFRVWRPHPRWYQWPDSPVRSALPVMRILRGLTLRIGAQIDSRLAGAGAWVLPDSVSLPSNPNAGGDDGDDEDPIFQVLLEVMSTAVKDQGSAAALVPVVLRVADETLKDWNPKDTYVRFDTPLDEQAEGLLERFTKRLALGLDLPAEMLLGMGDVNHWTGWLLSEDQIRLYVAPMASLICQALTANWLRPALGDTEDMVWFSTTSLQLRPDRSRASIELYERGAVGVDTMRRENGFGDDDAPGAEEERRQLLTRIVTGAPSLAPLILPLLDIEVTAPSAPPAEASPAEPPGPEAEDQGAPARPDTPPAADGQPEAPRTVTAAATDALDPLAAACHIAVTRALEVAGKRLRDAGGRSHRGELNSVPVHEMHTQPIDLVGAIDSDRADRLLDGAWACLATALPDHAERITPVLDCYVRGLLKAKIPHRMNYLTAALKHPDKACA